MATKFRKQSGSMLILAVLTIGLIIAAALTGISFCTFLSQNGQSQHKVDSLALSYASKINVGNRVGQMNELVDRCRQLVFVSRSQFVQCSEGETAFLAPLAHQLVSEAHEGQALVEREQRNQVALITQELQQGAIKQNENVERGPFTFLGYELYEPRVQKIELGSIKNLQSSVRSGEAIPELAEHDKQHGYVEGGSHLYKGNINARLPDAADSRLDFRFSPLAALVENSTTPARNAHSRKFEPAAVVFREGKPACGRVDYTPSAVKVTCDLDVALANVGSQRGAIVVTSTGVTCGACPDPAER